MITAAQAAPSMCGDPPPSIPVVEQDKERINGEIDGQARVLESLIGKGEFKGKADAYREHLYRDPDKLRAAPKEQRFFYIFCRLLEDSKDLSTSRKFELLQEMQGPLSSQPTQHLQQHTTSKFVPSIPTHGFHSFDVQIDGHAEINRGQTLINIAGFSISPGRRGQGGNCSAPCGPLGLASDFRAG